MKRITLSFGIFWNTLHASQLKLAMLRLVVDKRPLVRLVGAIVLCMYSVIHLLWSVLELVWYVVKCIDRGITWLGVKIWGWLTYPLTH